MAEEKITSNENQPVDLSGLGAFDFTPSWARGDAADTSKFKRFEAREERRETRARGADGAGRKPFGERKPFASGKPQGERKPFAARKSDDAHRPAARPPRVFVKPLDADVRILPSQKELGPVIRKIQTSHLAYPLKNLAYFFLDHPEACVLRVSSKKGAEKPFTFHQCKACGWTAFDADALLEHVVSAHMTDYYEAEEIACDPPKGVFSCVAKCGLSGELLGPPNLHGYDARIREMIRTRYAHMREDEYRARIVTVRDPEVIEAWRQSAVKKTIYRLKKAPVATDAPEGVTEMPALEREVAEAEFRRTLAPALMSSARTVNLPAHIALACPDKAFVYACRDALAKERRFPASLFFALRGAFHHRKLFFFRANDARGPEFVSASPFSPLDCAHAVPALAEIVSYVAAHPEATRASFSQEQQTNLSWLIEKGHLVGYYNGALAVACEHPLYRAPRKQAAEAPVEAASAETPAETPAEVASAETPAETPVEAAPAPAETPAEAPAEAAPAETPAEAAPAQAAPAETPVGE